MSFRNKGNHYMHVTGFHQFRNVNRNLITRFVVFLSFVLIIQVVALSPALAIEEGAPCNSTKYGNSGVMKNGQIHGGIGGPNENYSGPVYYCSGDGWVFWHMAKPPKSSSSKTVDVKKMQLCKTVGTVVQSTSDGTLVCKYVLVRRILTKVWIPK